MIFFDFMDLIMVRLKSFRLYYYQIHVLKDSNKDQSQICSSGLLEHDQRHQRDHFTIMAFKVKISLTNHSILVKVLTCYLILINCCY